MRTPTLLLCLILAAPLAAQQAVPTASPRDVSGLPPYQPGPTVSGLIRNNGMGMAGLMATWEQGFKKYHPQIRFQDSFLSGDNAVGALEAGASDLAPNGREPVLTEFLSFAEVFGNDGPFQVTVATGAYKILGRTWAQAIFVNKDNPLAKLTMDQLDRIFSSERLGTYRGYKWVADNARPASTNIRTWGQLGLTGEWADKPIQTYGYAPTGMSNFFELAVFHGGTTWNGNYRQYIETEAKQATFHAGTMAQMMDDLSHDRYGIAWAGLAHAEGNPNVKAIALGTSAAGPFYACNEQTVHDRVYPLTRSVFIQLNRPPGQPIEPKLKEFLRYILSREGQQAVAAQGEYLPLTAAEAARQVAALE